MKQTLRSTIILLLISFYLLPVSYGQQITKAFEHLSLGLEIATTGAGLELATTLNSHFTLRGGFSLLPYSYTTAFDIDSYGAEFDEVVNDYQQIRDDLAAKGLPVSSSVLDTEVDLKASSGMYNGKLLVDMHPSKKSGFRIVAGVYVGKDKLVKVEGRMPEQLTEVTGLLNDYKDVTGKTFETSVAIGDYTVKADELGYVDAAIKISGIKPYAGLGFGRSVPKRRVGFQFELGAMFHGKPKVVSSNGDVQDILNAELESDGAIEIMNKVVAWPVLSFKLAARIF